jgi:ribosomal protein S18 acetylase RimI-like enzyme
VAKSGNASWRFPGISAYIKQRILQCPGYPYFKKVFLLLGKKNRKAKGFYKKNGYIRVGTIPSLFEPSVDEYLMMKDLGKGKRTKQGEQ